MKAVNLIPREARSGGVGGVGVPPVYAVLGGLAIVLIAVVALVLTSNGIKDRERELATVRSEAAAAEQRASSLKPFGDFAQLKATRVTNVQQLADSRFPWKRTLRGLATVLPSNVLISSLTASKSGATTSTAPAGATATPTTAGAPTFVMAGCTVSHPAVARMIVALRQLDGVSEVSLADAGTGAGGTAKSGSCGGSLDTTFNLTVTFKPVAAQATTAGAGTSPSSSAASTTSTDGSSS